jgi:hypothetical protein
MSFASNITALVTAIASAINGRGQTGPSDFQMWVAQDPTNRASATIDDYRAAQLGADQDFSALFTAALGTAPAATTATEARAGITQLASAAEVTAGAVATKAVSPLQLFNAGFSALINGANATGARLGTLNQDLTGGDWNNALSTGFFRGSNMANAPGGSGANGWTWVIVQAHDPSQWISQIGHTYTSNGGNVGTNQVWRRVKLNGTWTAWTLMTDDLLLPHRPQRSLNVNDSFELITTPGTYQFNGGSGQPAGFPSGADNYGELIVFQQQYGVVQLYVGATIYIRSQWNAMNQSPPNMGRANWQKMTTTAVAPV